MSAGTKIFLAGAVIFVAVLVGYYGVFTPQPVERPVDPITAEPADTPAPAPEESAERTDDGVRHLVPARRDTRMTPSTANAPDASSRAARDETPNEAAARSKAPDTARSSARTSTGTETPRTDATARAQPSGTPRSTLNAPPRGASASSSGDPAASRSSAPATTAPPKRTPAKPRAAGPSSTGSSRTAIPETGSGRRPSAPPATVPYTIRSGDTLSSIAERRLGGAQHWTRIARANPLLDPNRLRVGEVIRIPAVAATPSSAARGRPVSPPKPRTSGTVTYHVVRSGETLSDIADEHYGDSALWQMLYDANRPAIGTDPDRLEVGTRIVIPRKPR